MKSFSRHDANKERESIRKSEDKLIREYMRRNGLKFKVSTLNSWDRANLLSVIEIEQTQDVV